METFELLMEGFRSAITPGNLLAVMIGAILGTIVGILPGLGPSTTVAVMIPVAFTMPADSGMIMMLAVYSGAMYGASLTSILLNVPGAASAVMSTVDGYPLAKQGRAGPAIAITTIGSFVGGTLSVVGLMLLAVPLSQFALNFGPVEYTAVMIFALMMSATLIGDSVLKGIFSIGMGLAIALVGIDLQTGIPRFTLGIDHLLSGIDMVVVIIGVFGVGEVLHYLASRKSNGGGERLAIRGGLIPTKEDFRVSTPAIGRGSLIGFIAGLLPGSGSTLGSYLSYSFEKRVAKNEDEFGKGSMRGLASVDAANSSATGGAMVPMFTLGIPGSGTTAVLLGALMMYGVSPGPQFMTNEADLVWAIIASLFIANVILIVLNLPLIPLFVKVLDIPTRILMPLVLVIAFTGAFTINFSFVDLWLVLIFGVVGFFMRVGGFSPALLVLAIVLGEMLERSLRQALLTYQGDLSPFVTSPISAILLGTAAVVLIFDVVQKFRARAQGK